MADVRSVVVRLSAETSSYIAKMQQAGTVTETSMGKSEKAAHKASVGLTDVEKAGAAGAVALAGMALVASADFDQAMSNVEAATHGTAAEMGSLEQAALDAGKATKFSATEAAAGIENLAKAGVSTSDILGGGLTGALDLAAAGELGVADAAEIAATALTQFSLSGADIPHVADLLAAGAGKAQGEVTDLAQALNQSGLVAAQMGLSIEETTGTLAAFAKAGLLGSDAGTSLKTMLLRLANPSKEASKEMERFGISAYDAQGNMLPMADIAGQLQTAFKGQSQATRDAALATIFGSDAIRAANVLYAQGSDGIQQWTTAVDDAGFAAETAAIKMDNLKGDVEVLMGSIETALIGSGEGSQDTLRTTTQLLTELVDAMSAAEGNDFIGGAADQLSIVNSDVFKSGLAVLQKTKFELFGVDKATTDAAEATEAAAAASEDKADADALAAAEASRLGSEARFSAEELEAQADALQDARDAANDTAQGFVNLGDSLNDGKKSLGQWINEMASQADALNNFTANAQKAAKNGLRDGLIAALKEAGPEGALRMRQLANATQAEIDKANAAWLKGQRAIDRYVDATVKVPKEKSTRVEADTRPALASFKAVDQWLSALDGKTATTYVKTVTSHSLQDTKLRASGGPVWGAGTATSDSIPAMLSNGEYVIRAAAVDHYGIGTFDRLNAMRLAGGGAASDSPERTKREREERERREEARRRAEERRRREEERRQRQLDRQRTKALLASNLGDDSEQAALEVADARRRLRSAKKADRPKGEVLEARLALKQERAEQRDLQKREAADRAQAAKEAEEERQRIAQEAEDERIRIAQEAADRQREIDEAVLDGQQRAWDQAIDAATASRDAAQAMVDSVKENMDRLGKAATAAFENTIFDKSSQQHGLWTGANTSAAGDWRGNLTGDIQGLQVRSSLISQLSDPSLGLSATALEALLGQADNDTIAAMLAAGEVDDYAALFAQREALLGSVSTQAGMAGYGQEYEKASAQLVMTNQKLDLLTAIIAAARPITVTETISAAAMVAEIARLQAAAGGY